MLAVDCHLDQARRNFCPALVANQPEAVAGAPATLLQPQLLLERAVVYFVVTTAPVTGSGTNFFICASELATTVCAQQELPWSGGPSEKGIICNAVKDHDTGNTVLPSSRQ